jgi:hypothetical protein
MHGLPSYQKLILALQVLLLLLLVVRLSRDRLHRVYPFFFWFLIAEAIQSLCPFLITYGTWLYRDVFLVSQTIIISFFTLVVLELLSIVLRDLKGIASIARAYTSMAIGVAVLFSALLLGLERSPTNLTSAFFIFERSIVSSLVFFVLLITIFLVYYPIPLTRNIVVYFCGYAFYFLCRAAGLFAQTTGAANLAILNGILLTGWAISVLFWLIFLNGEGEHRCLVLGHRWRPQDEGRLLQQLQAINATLLRSARK